MTEGEIYGVSNFNVTPNKPKYKIVPHIAMLQFAIATSFTPITTPTTNIPMHKFYFVDFNHLPSRTDVHDILSGIISPNTILLRIQIFINTHLKFFILIFFPFTRCYRNANRNTGPGRN